MYTYCNTLPLNDTRTIRPPGSCAMLWTSPLPPVLRQFPQKPTNHPSRCRRTGAAVRRLSPVLRPTGRSGAGAWFSGRAHPPSGITDPARAGRIRRGVGLYPALPAVFLGTPRAHVGAQRLVRRLIGTLAGRGVETGRASVRERVCLS